MVITVVMPTGRWIRYIPKSGVHARALARSLARKHGLWHPGDEWELHGPIGPIDPRRVVKSIELYPGEVLRLVRASCEKPGNVVFKPRGGRHG